MLYLQIFNKGFYQYSKKWAIKKAGDEGQTENNKGCLFLCSLGFLCLFFVHVRQNQCRGELCHQRQE
jgi:hypothetical protein